LAITTSCTDGNVPIVQTGALGPGNGDDGPDAPPGQDASGPPTDAVNANMCVGAATDVGPASSFTTGSPMYFSTGKFFVVRDSGGLYAITAKCTHEGATCIVQSGEFYCPRHGAEFTFNGDIIGGPVFNPLIHYGMCVMSNGNVGVQTSMTVAKTVRLAV
jgi:nitrite reductase/ring-hydroxylating ferredoxin subunit